MTYAWDNVFKRILCKDLTKNIDIDWWDNRLLFLCCKESAFTLCLWTTICSRFAAVRNLLVASNHHSSLRWCGSMWIPSRALRSNCHSSYTATVLPNVLFFRQIWLFFYLVGGENLRLAGGGFVGYFRNISAENLADFCTRFRPVFVSWKSCKTPHNIVYCRQIHCIWMCKVSPVESPCLVRLRWSTRPMIGRCSRPMLDSIESAYSKNRRRGMCQVA